MNYDEVKNHVEYFIRRASEVFSSVEISKPFNGPIWNEKIEGTFCKENSQPAYYKNELVYPDLKINVKEKPEALDYLFDIDIESLSDDCLIELNFSKDIGTECGSEYYEIQLFLSREAFIHFKYFIDLKFGYSDSFNWSASTSFHARNNAAVDLLLEKSKDDDLKKFILLNLDLFYL